MEVQDFTIEVESTNYECQICCKSYKSKSSLNQHLKSHTGEKNHPCQCCEKTFVHAYLLKRHERTHKNTNEKHMCETCGTSYTSTGSLSDHKKFKHLNEGFLCDHCNKRFKSGYHLRRHLKSHYQEKKCCSMCGRLFRRLADHKKICGKRTREPKATCSLCGKTFLENKYLNEHIRYTHREGASLNCKKCESPFKHRKTLNKHEKSCSVPLQ